MDGRILEQKSWMGACLVDAADRTDGRDRPVRSPPGEQPRPQGFMAIRNVERGPPRRGPLTDSNFLLIPPLLSDPPYACPTAGTPAPATHSDGYYHGIPIVVMDSMQGLQTGHIGHMPTPMPPMPVLPATYEMGPIIPSPAVPMPPVPNMQLHDEALPRAPLPQYTGPAQGTVFPPSPSLPADGM